MYCELCTLLPPQSDQSKRVHGVGSYCLIHIMGMAEMHKSTVTVKTIKNLETDETVAQPAPKPSFDTPTRTIFLRRRSSIGRMIIVPIGCLLFGVRVPGIRGRVSVKALLH
jgi:hypothetical protein